MASRKESISGLEWRLKVAGGSPEILAPEASPARRLFLGLEGFASKVRKFLKKAWGIGVDDPRKVIHCFKVGTALTVVSTLYYVRPLYQHLGASNTLWAIMTVVVIFENTVGATLQKSLNRMSATFLAGSLAFGVEWIAHLPGKRYEPFIVGASVFLLASAATFSRFIPAVKARFDYGVMIFILTFSLISVSGYRVTHFFKYSHDRISTIIIGAALCIAVCMFVCPIWAGQELHALTVLHMDKLADSLEACVAEYFRDDSRPNDNDKESHTKLHGYKCVLGSKTTEDSMANFARWEPAHGRFGFRHPWKQYINIAASMRSCAYCIEALNGCINSENKGSESIKDYISNTSVKLSSKSSSLLRELAKTVKTMKNSSNINILKKDMNSAVEELQIALQFLPKLSDPSSNADAETPENPVITMPLADIIQLLTLTSLLVEITSRINGIVDAVEELANLAEFKPSTTDKCENDELSFSFFARPAEK